MGPLTKEIMLNAIKVLDRKVTENFPGIKVALIMGGGGAMILAHGYPRGTTDIDAIPKGLTVEEIDPLVKETATELQLASDWLNPYFSVFSHTLPLDYATRLQVVYLGSQITLQALGKEEMLIMKCYAHRTKDIPHSRALVRSNIDLGIVERRLSELAKKNIPGTQEAMSFLQDVLDGEE